MIIKSDFIWCVYVKWETVCKMRRAKIKIGRPSACVTLKRTCVEQTSICHLSGIWHAYVQLSFKQCIQTCFHRMLVIVCNIGIGEQSVLKEHFTVHKCTMHTWQDPCILVLMLQTELEFSSGNHTVDMLAISFLRDIHHICSTCFNLPIYTCDYPFLYLRVTVMLLFFNLTSI